MRQPWVAPGVRQAAPNSPNDCFCTVKTLFMPGAMASDRMMKAIAALERAVSQLEQDVNGLLSAASSESSSGVDALAARAALQSLDTLITELKGQKGG